jgi:caffeoyl-CoA O-methyltransferase
MDVLKEVLGPGKDRRTQMKRILIVIFLVLAVGSAVLCQRASRGGLRGGYSTAILPQANSESEKKVLAVIEQVQANDQYLNVPAADGRMLRLLTEAAGAKNVVEIGTSTGLSGLWLCMALQKTGGKLTTFEYDAGRAVRAQRHFAEAGVDQIVTVVHGDAHQTIDRLKEPIDVVFIDADKEGYVDYLNKLLPFVRPGGLVLAHNVGRSDEYDTRVTGDPSLETLFYMEGGGLGITLKKR